MNNLERQVVRMIHAEDQKAIKWLCEDLKRVKLLVKAAEHAAPGGRCPWCHGIEKHIDCPAFEGDGSLADFSARNLEAMTNRSESMAKDLLEALTHRGPE